MNVLVDLICTNPSTAKAQVLRAVHSMPPTAGAIALASRAIVSA